MRLAAAVLILAGLIQQQDSPLARAQAKVDEARAAEKAGGDFDAPAKAGLAAFDEAVKADPSSVAARIGRADLKAAIANWWQARGDFTKRTQLESAIADYDEALKLEPGRVEAIAGRGYAKFKFQVSRFFARVHVDELFKAAFEDIDKAVSLRPGDASLHILRGDALLEKGKYGRYRADPHKPSAEAAIAAYQEAIRLDPQKADALAARIAAAGKLADSPIAVEDKGAFIVWSKSWELAKREAQIRSVPIFFYVSGGAG